MTRSEEDFTERFNNCTVIVWVNFATVGTTTVSSPARYYLAGYHRNAGTPLHAHLEADFQVVLTVFLFRAFAGYFSHCRTARALPNIPWDSSAASFTCRCSERRTSTSTAAAHPSHHRAFGGTSWRFGCFQCLTARGYTDLGQSLRHHLHPGDSLPGRLWPRTALLLGRKGMIGTYLYQAGPHPLHSPTR